MDKSKLLKDSIDLYNKHAEKLGLTRIQVTNNGYIDGDMSYVAISIYENGYPSRPEIMRKDLFYKELGMKHASAIEAVADNIITELILRGLNDIVNNQIKLK